MPAFTFLHCLCDDQTMNSLGDLPLPVSTPGDRQPRWTTLAERMTETQTPGVAVAVIDDGDLEWADAWGVLQAGNAAPVRAESIFQVCSVSKHVTMVGALRLIQEGRLDLDEDVNRRLTSWVVPPNGGWQPVITVRQLLGHTAGLTYNWYRGYGRGHDEVCSQRQGLRPVAHLADRSVRDVCRICRRLRGGAVGRRSRWA